MVVFPNSVNCETSRTAPPTSTTDRFILPASSEKIRRPAILPAMNRTFSILAALVLWLFTAAALRAQESPLELIPQDTLGFAVIHDLSDTNERVAKVTQKMQIPIGDLLTMAKGFLGVQEGLDEKGGLAIALVSGPQGREWEESVWCAVVPVTDYNKFLAPLDPKDPDAKITAVTIMGMNMLAARKGNFAVLASGETSETLERILAAKASVSAEVKPLAGWMADKQLAVVVTPAGKKLLLQTIVGALPDVEQLKKDAGDPAPEQLGAFENVGEIFGLLKKVLAGADEQLTHLALGLRIEDDASLRLAARVLFTQGGKLAAWSKEVKAPQESLLTGVPAGKSSAMRRASPGLSAPISSEPQATSSAAMPARPSGRSAPARNESTSVVLRATSPWYGRWPWLSNRP